MLWAEFGPYILPYAPGCPEPLLELHTRLAAIDFCRRTLCDTRSMDPVRAFASPIVEMDPPQDTRIVKVKRVGVAGRDRELVPANKGASLVRAQHPGDYCFTPDNLNLHVHPQPDGTADIVVDAALMPTLTSTGLLDDIANQYAQDIAHGALARIMLVQRQTFSDPNAAVLHAGIFASRVATVAAKVARGQAGAKMASHATYI